VADFKLDFPFSEGVLHARVLDLSDLQSVHRFCSWVLRSFPQLHVLVNNAGHSLTYLLTYLLTILLDVHIGICVVYRCVCVYTPSLCWLLPSSFLPAHHYCSDDLLHQPSP
jgi:hypothetical protein